MFIEDLNNKTKPEIEEIRYSESPPRLFFGDTKPNQEKLILYNDLVLEYRNDTSVCLSSRETNWIDLNDLKPISTNVTNLSLHTFKHKPQFSNLDGIEHFKKLKRISFVYCYSNKIDLNLLNTCTELEYLGLENSITKNHHLAINKLKTLKELSIKGLDISQLEVLPKMEFLYVLSLKNPNRLAEKMPNLKTLCIHNSSKILNLDFLQSLPKIERITLDSLSNVEKIPNLENNKTLKSFSIMNFKRLKEISKFNSQLEGLRIGHNVPELNINGMNMVTPENLPNLKNINVKLSHKEKSETILNSFRQKGIEIKY
ncbi:hypothetical protein [Tenacibaculum finnmarkense]|uniref:hypothetical protein n=1 Tax=Tenacibaculum finnmarkense TaxID=2781243 RepID=UPI001EFBA843|nr:hypothetical protein [Tenacibaculum finnmarkense]MCG8796659.1 hypothetical protein [Tenacibaculum finnmarkense]MCG8799005.1 hypothetical protein [Tenacibaculum finnmarkense]